MLLLILPTWTAAKFPRLKSNTKKKFLLWKQNEGKPEKIIEKMVLGRINKYYKEVCLVDQEFIKDGDLTIAKLLKSKNAEVLRFARYQLGEGIEKKQDDLAAEVAKQLNQ